VQLANKREFKQKKQKKMSTDIYNNESVFSGFKLLFQARSGNA
jgi:hypothetical protein